MQKILESIEAVKAFAGQPGVESDVITITQDMIDRFAAVTHDPQWIHVDPERAAKESPFGTTIAHGLLTLSLLTGWYHQCFAFPNRKLGLNYGFDKVRFIGPVPCGSRLKGRFALARVEEVKPQELRCYWDVEVRIEGQERPVLVAEWIMQIRY
ncbi:oxidoreductase [Alicycliphilus denitrificans]|jgi:acyl dehydratase|uniref:MaoC family dehydratase n=1 Tax=Alicycliphilus denitrificans TaxID=179636 RepID=UPI00095E39FC|nr:MaoC family dehydratase [Alicycliphilus denitrificans]MBN9574236.1 MaoC family dehydratase [Alicycliphilus denitrificans]OJW85777.1 MAG: oxidoreductase [Alicycliphilus sp. 69-12]BCN38094.1 oxidoreductase [Alicycliphilus denitrificans]